MPNSKTKKKKSLSPKQKALMRLLAQGSDRKTAALLAGYSQRTQTNPLVERERPCKKPNGK
jgi:DNA-binding CsgD family transcriptional regulator